MNTDKPGVIYLTPIALWDSGCSDTASELGLASQHLAAYSGDLERGSIAALQWGIGPLG